MNDEPFILDLDSNPHPRMLHAALRYRRAARASDRNGLRSFWRGYRMAMADATGCTEDDLEAWLDRHEAP